VVERCRHEIPPLDPVVTDHVSACWLARDLPTAAAASA
jgi:hypothetical protein